MKRFNFLAAMWCFILLCLLVIIVLLRGAPAPDTDGALTAIPPAMYTGGLRQNKIIDCCKSSAEEEKTQMTDTMWSEADAAALAQMAYGEARGCADTEIAATMWCVLNRVDAWGGSIIGRVGEPGQFYGYSTFNPVSDRIYSIAVDVLRRWERERGGAQDVGRVLPADYLWFTGSRGHNWFRNAYTGGNVWDWRLPSPYEEV